MTGHALLATSLELVCVCACVSVGGWVLVCVCLCVCVCSMHEHHACELAAGGEGEYVRLEANRAAKSVRL